MKDARGHGSNSHGAALASLNHTDVGMFGASAGSRILKSNGAAAAELAKGNPKSAPAPIHSAHVGGAYAFEKDRAQDADGSRVDTSPRVNGVGRGSGPIKWTPQSARKRVGGTFGT